MNTPTVERILTFLYIGDYASPYPTSLETQSQQTKTDEDKQELNAKDVRSIGSVEEEDGENHEPGTIEAVAKNIPDSLIWPQTVLETPASSLDHLDGKDPSLQQAILESYSVRPLTPLGKCVGLSPVAVVRNTAGGDFECENFPSSTYSYHEPLMVHAQIYSFAKHHSVLVLRNLALQRMTQTLRKINCSAEHAKEELSEVIAFIYDNVPEDESEEDPMRKLLSHYAAMNYTSLLGGNFQELFTQGGDFTLDLGEKLSRRLSAHGVALGVRRRQNTRPYTGSRTSTARERQINQGSQCQFERYVRLGPGLKSEK
jgi:hypothetical protein